MADRPLCSIVMPLYNRRPFVLEAVASVLAQTRSEWELIVWDDASTDGSLEAVRELVGHDPRVRLLGSAVNRGVTPTLISACGEARGEYLGTLDSDDRLHPTTLQETAAVLDRHPDVGMVYTRYRTIDARGRMGPVGERCMIPYDPNRLLLSFMTFHFRLMRRSVYEQVGGFDAAYPRAPDYDLCLRLSEVTKVRQVKKPLYDYRVHRDSISMTSRMEQIDCSRRAVEAALVRRGAADEYELHVELTSRFRLIRKQSAQP